LKWAQEHWKVLLAGGAAYAMVCSLLYLWAYWGVFDLNPLHYISFAQLFETALYLLAFLFFSSISILLAGAFVNFVFSSLVGSNGLKTALFAGGFVVVIGSFIPISAYFRDHAVVYTLPFYFNVFSAALMSGIVVNAALHVFLSFRKHVIPVLICLVAFPAMSYVGGWLNGLGVYESKDFQFVLSSNVEGYSEDHHVLKFLGSKADSFVFYSMDNELVLLKKDDVDPLVLHTHKLEP
jgi:hypothetical protein